MSNSWRYMGTMGLALGAMLLSGCRGPTAYRRQADHVAHCIIQQKEEQLFGPDRHFCVEQPVERLRRQLLVRQNLPIAGCASLGPDCLMRGYPYGRCGHDDAIPLDPYRPLRLSLVDSLQIGARNHPEYQRLKEEVFRAALDLDLERHAFCSLFHSGTDSSFISDFTQSESVVGTESHSGLAWSKLLCAGQTLAASLATDLVKLLTLDHSSAFGLLADATVSIPLLRGASHCVVQEPLTQAQREVVYRIYELERFKKSYAVQVASAYLNLVQQSLEVESTTANYRNLKRASLLSFRLSEAGRLPMIQYGQALQKELQARTRWIAARKSFDNQLDSFKRLVGLPPDAKVELTDDEGKRMEEELTAIRADGLKPQGTSTEPEPLSSEGKSPLELDPEWAVRLALSRRLDLKVALGQVYDARRRIAVAADALKPSALLVHAFSLGESKSLLGVAGGAKALHFGRGSYSSLLSVDFGLERTAERNAYRASFLDFEQAIRNSQSLEDRIKENTRSLLRDLTEAREATRVEGQALLVAEQRVKSTRLFFEAGRAEVRDLLEAEDSLLTAHNALIEALVSQQESQWNLLNELELLQVNEQGLSFDSEELRHE